MTTKNDTIENTEDVPENIEAIWFERYCKMFFTGISLQKFLIYASNHCTVEIQDPICSTVKTFLNIPVIFCLTNLGLMPFKDNSTILFPLKHMTVTQQKFLQEYVKFIKYNKIGTSAVQMGGAVVLSITKCSHQPKLLDSYNVISAVLKAVIANNIYENKKTKVFICNIILQRIGVLVGITRENIKKLHENIMIPFCNQDECCLD